MILIDILDAIVRYRIGNDGGRDLEKSNRNKVRIKYWVFKNSRLFNYLQLKL